MKQGRRFVAIISLAGLFLLALFVFFPRFRSSQIWLAESSPDLIRLGSLKPTNAMKYSAIFAVAGCAFVFSGPVLRSQETTLQTKAAILTAMGREADAVATMDKALHLPGAEPVEIHPYAMGLLRGGKKEKAMEIFQFNSKQHPDGEFYTYVGLARRSTAMGETEKAIKNWEIALQNIPETQKPNRPVYEKALQDLKAK